MARIPLALVDRSKRPSLLTRLALAYSRMAYGGDLDSALAMSHHPGVFWPWGLMEMVGERRRSVLPEHLDDLVVFVTAVHLGCSWCIDFGASLWERKCLDPAILREASHWRTSGAFDDDEKAAFGYAETVSGDLSNVTDEMVADLRERFGDAGVVELTYLIALENMRSRFNTSLGMTSQGFSSGEACVIPLLTRAQTAS
ncbi:MAG: carboxymuconolactone decarboxylase family protein [Actinomycetota bacterium]|nr:carboxymuconolactone decarboxylase family protein [Actinomycetota bacterium]